MTCQRFEALVLPEVEAGRPVPHLETCAVCRGRLAELEHIKDRLAAVPARDEGDWEARIWARIAAEPPPRRVHLWRWLVGSLLACGAVATAVVVFRPGPPPDAPFVWTVVAGETNRLRGKSAHPGDRLTARAAPDADLRLFREGTLVQRCGEGPACRREARGLVADLELAAPGRYRLVSLPGTLSVEPGLDLDATLAAARAAGAGLETSPPIDVE